jgi:hypothetical protein
MTVQMVKAWTRTVRGSSKIKGVSWKFFSGIGQRSYQIPSVYYRKGWSPMPTSGGHGDD